MASALPDTTSHFLQHTAATYQEALQQHPLVTKMITGGTLATCGDAIAQSQNALEPYDKRRAVSFMLFDMCYRALQHTAFPVLAVHCQGQYLGELLQGTPLIVNAEYLAAMERTLASQLGIVPFIYYPVFYALTALVQDLSPQAAVDRARETFVPLMSKNLKFWIPVQFIQFGFIEEHWQIPFLSAAGLCWTFLLSLAAGSTRTYQEKDSVSYLADSNKAFPGYTARASASS
ncbi:hypothetical protein FisN_22Hh003 [Fistulifera solaris]|uniref:Protein Mpv17 n=1 Tax=Fistulifera solaris TaxID=1519565 RepID=A0A1Z5K2D7_FISSO|nr:hypothetical protein FisN_22Hh003 [Fistulifera solaris]|eukprot:GAX20437.1 hypothetical protein FisN_22Hh003 [Fistulifera solaris]